MVSYNSRMPRDVVVIGAGVLEPGLRISSDLRAHPSCCWTLTGQETVVSSGGRNQDYAFGLWTR